MTPIHIAPCSCELHVRIRELEQTLEEGLDYLRFREQELAVVTEKLEKEKRHHAWSIARAEKAEARVAELECENDPVKLGERIALQAAREARESKGED